MKNEIKKEEDGGGRRETRQANVNWTSKDCGLKETQNEKEWIELRGAFVIFCSRQRQLGCERAQKFSADISSSTMWRKYCSFAYKCRHTEI